MFFFSIEDSLELSVDYSLDSSLYDEVEKQENLTGKETEGETNEQSSIICTSPKVIFMELIWFL